MRFLTGDSCYQSLLRAYLGYALISGGSGKGHIIRDFGIFSAMKLRIDFDTHTTNVQFISQRAVINGESERLVFHSRYNMATPLLR